MTQSVDGTNSKNSPLFVGIDGGGSKCRAIIYQNDKILGTGIAGPANPFHGFEPAVGSVLRATELALKDAGLTHSTIRQLIAGVGLAGVNLPHLYDRVNNWSHPFKKMYLATDLHIACVGSHQGEPGAVIITGTGSCGYSYVNDEPFILGAHGFPHGDKGSGAWFGFSAIEHVLLAMDGLAEQTTLTQSITEQLGCKSDLDLVTAIIGQKSSYFARLAATVFDAADAGDNVARRIIEDGARYISDLARKLLARESQRISIIGGLSERLKPWLDEDVIAVLSVALSPPEMGAVIYARQQYNAQQQPSFTGAFGLRTDSLKTDSAKSESAKLASVAQSCHQTIKVGV